MKRPRIKFPHRPVRHGQDLVRIGGIVRGIGAFIPDPDGWVWALLERLDGSRTVEQVVGDMLSLFPDRPGHDVRLAIGELTRAGYLEDAAEAESDDLTVGDRERYSRSWMLYQWMDRVPRRTNWDTQVLLRRAKVVLLGLGGVGCSAALALTVSGVGHVHCVDRDVVELSNLNRQILYTEQDIGRPKTEAAVRRLREYNSSVRVTGEQRDIDGPDAVRAFSSEFDVVLLAADQPPAIRSWTNRACLNTGTAWVHGGYHGPLITVGVYRPGTGPCYDCFSTAEQAGHTALPPGTGWSPATNVIPPQAANAVTAGMTGYLAAHATISLITDVPALRFNRRYGLNLVTLQTSLAYGLEAPHPRCPTCGPRR